MHTAVNRSIYYSTRDVLRRTWLFLFVVVVLAALASIVIGSASYAVPLAGLMFGMAAAPQQYVPMVPFVAAAHEHVEPAFVRSVQLAANTQALDPIDIPAYGYLRHVFLEITCAGGVVGTAVATEDFPWNIIQSVTLLDVNGAPIVGPIDGYALLWANIAGGYAFRQDPRDSPWFVGSVPNPAMFLRVPLEISHFDGLGALANQNSAAPYKLQITLNNTTGIITGAFGTIPTVTIRGWVEAWSLPNAQDVRGRPQQQLPPAHGTGQFWTTRRPDVAAGAITVPINRVGNLLRNVLFITRTAAGVRSDTVMPEPILFNWDGRQQWQESQRYRIQAMFEKLVDAARDTGVWLYPFAHSIMGRNGDENPNLWLPTVQSTRMELAGSAAAGGTVQVVINDIQPVEVHPAERYTENSDTTFRASPGPAAAVSA